MPNDHLEITVNSRLRKNWWVRADRKTGKRVLCIPKVLADAPPEIMDCLTRWAMLPMSRRARRGAECRLEKRNAEKAIFDYMESAGVAPRRASRVDPAAFERQTAGAAYNLREIFDSMNRAFFNNEIISSVRWGRAASGTSYHTVKSDKEGNPFNLITISGIYDSRAVPEYAIRGLMYHEMLHIAIPPRTVNGRRVIHGRDFKAAERKYPYYDQWVAWEKENAGRLLANARRRKKRFF
jgi:hypothetical protein